jgi:hypothetical protein
MATQIPIVQSPTNVLNAEGHTILKIAKNLKTLHPYPSYGKGDILQTTKAA